MEQGGSAAGQRGAERILDKNQSEIFGEFTYAESMSYEDLLACEADLLEQLGSILQEAGAEHLDFTPLGDILMLQCAFEIKNLEIMRDVTREIAAILQKGITGRLLCLETNLVSCHIFWISQGKWQEKEYILPRKGPEDAPVHSV